MRRAVEWLRAGIRPSRLEAPEDRGAVVGHIGVIAGDGARGRRCDARLDEASEAGTTMFPSMPEPPDPSPGAPSRVLIADDDPDVRAVLAAQLALSFDIVGTAADTDEAIALAAEHRPDIALVGGDMPGGGGPRATREISAATPATAIVALSADESDRVVRDMLAAGAVTYIRKGVTAEELTALLHESVRARAQLSDAG
jgi:CheY-like chemotaxis protein